MHFESLQAFLAMGGYGFYVWLSFLGTFLSIVVLAVAANIRTRKLREQVLKEHKRMQRFMRAKQQE